MIVKAYDIDGTLLQLGFIPDKTIERYKTDLCSDGVTAGILTARPKALMYLGINLIGGNPAFAISAELHGKYDELMALREKYPDADEYIYVGNRASDGRAARKADFTFVRE